MPSITKDKLRKYMAAAIEAVSTIEAQILQHEHLFPGQFEGIGYLKGTNRVIVYTHKPIKDLSPVFKEIAGRKISTSVRNRNQPIIVNVEIFPPGVIRFSSTGYACILAARRYGAT